MILDPTEIPIGVVTALLGVPLFLVLLRRSLSG
jgi:iron complex transport system permease protein